MTMHNPPHPLEFIQETYIAPFRKKEYLINEKFISDLNCADLE
jgi:hypothetical protein